MNIEHTAKATTICTRCGAKPGRSCITSGGRPTSPHSVRSRALYAVWRDGYAYGSSDLASHALDASRNADADAWARFVQRAERIIAAKESAK